MASILRFSFLSTLFLLPSILGRTPFMSCIKPYLQENTHLTDTWISFVYMLGTYLASVLVSCLVCGFKEHFPLRFMLRFLYSLLIVCLLGLIGLTNFQVPFLLKIPLLGLFFTGIRLCCQGGLPLCIRSLTASRYPASTCAWLASLHTTTLMLITGLVLYFINKLQLSNAWPILWGIAIGFMSFLCAWVPQENLPIPPHKTRISNLWRLKNFPKSFLWALGILAFINFQATALTFHLSDFALEKNMSLAAIYRLFLPLSILELILTPFASWCTNRFHSKILSICLLLLILINISLLFFDNQAGRAIFVLLCAGLWSLNHILSYRLPPALLSKENIPLGFAALLGWCNVCSAAGPYLYSVLASFHHSYQMANIYILFLNLIVGGFYIHHKKVLLRP